MGIRNKRGIKLFEESGALINGHFRLQGGRDSLCYVAKELLCEQSMIEICNGIAEDFMPLTIDTVVGPENGAVKYAEYTTMHLARISKRPIAMVRARKVPDGKKLFYIADEDMQHIVNKKILVVEDVFTTGENAAKVIALIRSCNGIVIGVGGVWNRGNVTARDLGVDIFISQINEQYPSYEPGEPCPGCREKIPYNMEWGHGKNLVGKHPLATR